MTEKVAENAGFVFTGACWSSWEEERAKQYKKEAAEIKKKFKGADYRIVSGTASSWLGTSSKGIYGNEIFRKVQYWKETELQIKLNNIEAQRKELLARLEQLKQAEINAISEDEEIRKLLK